jgi:Mrp family chromosome partitioning ATPase
VIIDSPPVMAVADPMILASTADQVVLVADANRARRQAIRRAREVLASVNSHVVGLVVNKVATRGGAYYHYGAYQSEAYGPSSNDRSPGKEKVRST